jgi:transcription elongation GreA/GreB family factor
MVQVHFGSTVTIKRDGGRRQTFRIVGEDEAEPTRGTLSYVAPLARALIGKEVGDVVPMGEAEAEIIAIA